MKPYTFKMKMLESDSRYKFTEAEIERLQAVLRELATEIENSCGITFNAALANIVRKDV